MQRSRITGRGGRAGLLAIAVGGLVVLGVSPGTARDSFVAGGRSTEPLALDGAGRQAALDRAGLVGRALGLPAGARTVVVRLRDRFESATVDEVTTFDAGGRPIAIQRFNPDGRLRTAVRLGWSTARGDLTASAARIAAASLLARAGITGLGQGVATGDPNGRGWTVSWPRRAAGARVQGDGTWVRLWADGSLHSVATVDSPLAPVPPSTLTADAARRLAEAQLGSWSRDGGPVGAIAALELAWIAPNDLFDPARPDAPDPVRRLAWVVRVTPAATLASRLRALELYIDAGDGRLLGGDLLE